MGIFFTTKLKAQGRQEPRSKRGRKEQVSQRLEPTAGLDTDRSRPPLPANFTKGLPHSSGEGLIDFEDFRKFIIEDEKQKPELDITRLFVAVGFLVLILLLGIFTSHYGIEPWDSVLPSTFQLLVGAVIGALIGEKIGTTNA